MAGVKIGGYGSAAGHLRPHWTPAAISAIRANAPGYGLVQAAAGQGIGPSPGYPAPTGASPGPIDTQNQPGVGGVPYTGVESVAPVTLTHTTKTGPNGTEKTTQATQAPPDSGPAPVDPRDAQYWQTYNQNLAKANQQIAAFNLQDTQEQTSTAEAIRQLLEHKPEDIQNIDNSASAAGGLYTGHRNTLQGDLETSYLEKQQGIQSTFDNAHAQRNLAIQAIRDQLPIDDNQALLDAVGRGIANPANAGSTPPPPGTPPGQDPVGQAPGSAHAPLLHSGTVLPVQLSPLQQAAALVTHGRADSQQAQSLWHRAQKDPKLRAQLLAALKNHH